MLCIFSTSHGLPNTCTPRIALVLSVIRDSIFVASIVRVLGLISQKTGVKLFQSRACTVAGKVKGVVITSPLRSNAFKPSNKAKVPLVKRDKCVTLR
jgi:hypothetical protein